MGRDHRVGGGDFGRNTNEVTSAEWPLFRGNPQLAGVASGVLPDKLALLWTFKTGEAIKSSAVISRGRVFIGSNDGKLYALSLRDGSPIWQFDAGDSVEAPPMVVDDLVVAGSLKGVLFALDAKTGQERWRYETGGKSWVPPIGFQARAIKANESWWAATTT